MMTNQYLVHFGIKGQKWGVRRFQNEDRTWTEAGKERYGSGNDSDKKSSGGSASSSKSGKKGLTDSQKKALKTAAIVAGTAAVAGLAVYGGAKYVDAVKTEAWNQTVSKGQAAIRDQERMARAWRDIAPHYSDIGKDAIEKSIKANTDSDLASIEKAAKINSATFKNARATLKGKGVQSAPEAASARGKLTSGRQKFENRIKDSVSKSGYSYEDLRSKKRRTISVYDTRTAEGRKKMADYVAGKRRFGPEVYGYVNDVDNR